MSDTKQRVRFVKVDADQIETFKSTSRSEEGILYFLIGDVPELWLDNKRISIDDNMAHSIMAQTLGTAGSDEYGITYNDGCLEIKTLYDNKLLQLKLDGESMLISSASGNPIAIYDVVYMRENVKDAWSYDIFIDDCQGIRETGVRFVGTQACHNVVFNITEPLVGEHSYVFMGNLVYRVDYADGVPVSFQSVYNNDSKVEDTSQTFIIDEDILISSAPADEVSSKRFSPNGFHTFMLYLTPDNKYYLLGCGTPANNRATYPVNIVDNEYTYKSQKYCISEDFKTAGQYDRAFSNYDLVRAIQGMSNLVTTNSGYCEYVGHNLWGKQGIDPVDETELGAFSYNYANTVTQVSKDKFNINRTTPCGNYQLMKVEAKGILVTDQGERIQAPEVLVRGFEHDSVFDAGLAGGKVYIQFIEIARWKHPEDTSYTNQARLFYRTVKQTVLSIMGQPKVLPWSYAHEFITSDSTAITDCVDATTWGTF